ncbi:MAG: MBOAT family protein, partial [Eubacteriales bacterium]
MSIIVNHIIVFYMEAAEKVNRKFLMWLAICFNIGLLLYFKYFDFFIDNCNELLKTEFTLLNIMLPLGISFYTFQQISYVMDCYHKKVKPYGFLEYAAFVSFFPQLVAGPIVLHSELIPQFLDE